MKFLTNLYKPDEIYKITIVDSDNPLDVYNGEVDIKKLKECVNIKVNEKKFKSTKQQPSDYIKSDFSLEEFELISHKDKYFISDIYCDENGNIELVKTVTTQGAVQIKHITDLDEKDDDYTGFVDFGEFYPRQKNNRCLSGDLTDPKTKIPDYVKVSPLTKAYDFWKERDTIGNDEQFYFTAISDRFQAGAFITDDKTKTKLLMHYLTGVKGFQVAFHTTYQDKRLLNEGKIDNYTLYKDSSTISFQISEKGNYLGYNTPTMHISIKDGSTSLNTRDKFVMEYNKLENNNTISKDFKLFNDRFGSYKDFMPGQLQFLSSNLDAEKSGREKPYYAVSYNSIFSVFQTSNIIELASLYVSLQTYSKDFKAIVEPQMKDFDNKWRETLAKLINDIGLKNAEETLRWTKVNLKEELKDIKYEDENGKMQPMDVSVVDKLDNYLQIKRNNYSPVWLQKFGKNTIKALGGIDLLHELIEKRGEDFAKESINLLGYGIEDETWQEKRSKINEVFVKSDDLIIDKEIEIEDEIEME